MTLILNIKDFAYISAILGPLLKKPTTMMVSWPATKKTYYHLTLIMWVKITIYKKKLYFSYYMTDFDQSFI